MPLKKAFTHRLIRILQIVLPIVIIGLITVPAWNYWVRIRLKPRMPSLAKLPKEIAVRTDNFNFSKTQGDRTMFTIHATTNVGFNDDKNMLEGVDVLIYGDNPSDPTRNLKAKNCNYNQKTEDIECSGDVELRLDDATTVRTEEAVYNHVDKLIIAQTPSDITRESNRSDASSLPPFEKGGFSGHANNLEYSTSSGLMKLGGGVKIHGSEGVDLESGSAVFQQKENWATASDDVLMKSKNGWIRGRQARTELTPETYQPRTVVVEGDVSSESTAPDTGATWDLHSSWVQATLSAKGVVEHMLARTNVELTKKAPDSTMAMTGDEIETQMNDTGRMDVVEARQNARMKFGDDRLLTASRIWATADGAVSTEGPSVLEVGDARITGSVFAMQNGDTVTFHTEKRATLLQQERVTSADITDAHFDSRTNQLLSLVQTGHFTVKEGDQNGKANKATIESGGDILTLEGAATATDPRMQVEANTIQINDKTKTKTASKNVKTVSIDTGERVLVTADSAIETEDKVTYGGTYREQVHLYRGVGSIEADKVEGPVGSKVFRATATGRVFSTMNNIRTWADRLDYDDGTHIAHYIGSVTTLKQDIKITSDDMVVKLNEDNPQAVNEFTESSVQEITAKGKVVVTRSDSRGTGNQAVYDADTQLVVLTGSNAEVTDPQGITQGPRITVSVSGDKMTIVEGSGGQRAVTTRTLTGKKPDKN
jgi:lipopolysaccharide transport protein LptA